MIRSRAGQASVELLAGVPVLVLALLVALQLFVTAYSLHLADGAAEAGALALAGGAPAEPAARAALPGWARDRISVAVSGGRVDVSVQPPAPLASVGRVLAIDASAWAKPADG